MRIISDASGIAATFSDVTLERRVVLSANSHVSVMGPPSRLRVQQREAGSSQYIDASDQKYLSPRAITWILCSGSGSTSLFWDQQQLSNRNQHGKLKLQIFLFFGCKKCIFRIEFSLYVSEANFIPEA